MRIQARGGGIFVNDAGSGGTPLLFLHSLAGCSDQWLHQLAHVRRAGCAVAIDLRGHGRSDAPSDGDYSLELAADDALAVLDALGIDQACVVGHSMGGGVAVMLAGLHPERVAALLLVDPVGDQSRAPAEEMQLFLDALETDQYPRLIREYWLSIAGINVDVQRQVLEDLARTPKDAVIGMLRALLTNDLGAALTSYIGPKHALMTEHNDYPISLHNVDRALTFTRIEGTGHWPHLERPNEFNCLLDDFISRVTPQLAR